MVLPLQARIFPLQVLRTRLAPSRNRTAVATAKGTCNSSFCLSLVPLLLITAAAAALRDRPSLALCHSRAARRLRLSSPPRRSMLRTTGRAAAGSTASRQVSGLRGLRSQLPRRRIPSSVYRSTVCMSVTASLYPQPCTSASRQLTYSVWAWRVSTVSPVLWHTSRSSNTCSTRVRCKQKLVQVTLWEDLANQRPSESQSKALDFRNPENFFHDVNSVTGLLKQFLRELPDPILTSEHHDSFVAAASASRPLSPSNHPRQSICNN
jgi:hypothetical protein